MKKFLQHIEIEELVRRAESGLPDKNTDEHLAECAECSDTFQKLQNFFTYAEVDSTETVPQSATAYLLNIYQPKIVTPRENIADRIRAILAFDDWLPEFAVNERLAYADSRQMLFRAAEYEIDMRLNFANGKCQASGQIFPDCEDGEIEISSKDFKEKALLNAYCEFILPFVPEGIYDFKLRLDNIEIEIKQVSLFS